MGHDRALGLLLMAVGVVIYFLLGQLWSRSKKDPEWFLLADVRNLLGPETTRVIHAVVLVFGALAGVGAVGLGLFLLRWV